MKIHVLTLLSTKDCETATEVIGAYYCPFKAEEDGTKHLVEATEEDSYYSYDVRILETEVK